MQTLILADGAPLPLTILLPMRLIAYNRGTRQLIITAHTTPLAQPIVTWLQESVQHHTLIDRIL